MSPKMKYRYGEFKQNRFPPLLFAVFFCVLLLMSGLHIGLIVLIFIVNTINIQL